MYSSLVVQQPLRVFSWRRIYPPVVPVVAIDGDPEAEVTAYFVYKGVPRPYMPIAYIRQFYRYQASADPNTGQSPSSIPQYGQ